MEAKTHEFKAEISRMLDLVINSLYSKKEIFLRELVSNASDAIDRAKYNGLTDKTILADNPEWKIKIIADKDAGTLTICDNGMGMDAAEMENNLGTIASSGTKAFTEALKKDGEANLPELIGQFGVGFYAAFMVADKVTVVTKKRGSGETAQWESDGKGSFTVQSAEKQDFGTNIIVKLRDDFKNFLDEWKIQELIREYSDFIAYPIYFGDKTVKQDAKPLNTMVALWKRPAKDVKPEEYAEFYKHLTRDWTEPLETITQSGEGAVEFKALLFIPQDAGMDMYMPQTKHGLSLYVRNVFIGNDFDLLLPQYLRFVKGVVDSADLPLNVSREMLQDDAVIRKIKAAVTGKVISTLENMKEKDHDKYLKFFKTFGRMLKEGAAEDYANKDRLEKLLLYPSAKNEDGKLISLDEYVKAMPPEQTDIYCITGEKENDARKSPQIESALKHGCDVLLWTDPVDAWLADYLTEFGSKKIKDLSKEAAEFGTSEERAAEKVEAEKAADTLKGFMDAIKEQLKDDISEVKISTRLTDSPCCLVAAPGAMSASMERMMRAMNREVPKSKRIFEINAKHPLISKIASMEGEERKEAVELLFCQALVAEGSDVPSPARFASLLVKLMLK